MLRRRLQDSLPASACDETCQLRLSFPGICNGVAIHEYAVPVTSLDAQVLTIARLYRDRADCENVFDELDHISRRSLDAAQRLACGGWC